MKTEKAIFAAGCFWKPDYYFTKLKGVLKTKVGYIGGRTKNPSYTLVCTGLTGHAEAVLVEYDPKILKYEELVKTFFEVHNPTTKNRQGLDIGTQYRSAIYFFDEKQKETAQKILNEYQKKLDKKIVTKIESATEFYEAEEYHQKYYEKKGKTSC